MNKTISVIIPNFNGKDLLDLYLPYTFYALEHSQLTFEIIVVDDASTDESATFLRTFYPEIKLLQNTVNKGFSYTCNVGIREAKNELVLLLNSDIRLNPEYFEKLIPYFDDKDTFGVMGKILSKSGEKIEVAAKLPKFNGLKLKSDKQFIPIPTYSHKIPTIFLSGANCLIDRVKLVELDGFDEIYSPFYSEDADLCMRAWKLGWKCYYEHQATCFHLGSHTTKSYFRKAKIKEIYFRNRMLFHAIHLKRKEVKQWQLHLLLLEVLPKLLLGQFWILNAYSGFRKRKNEVQRSRRKLSKLLMKNRGRRGIEDVITDINSLLVNSDLMALK